MLYLDCCCCHEGTAKTYVTLKKGVRKQLSSEIHCQKKSCVLKTFIALNINVIKFFKGWGTMSLTQFCIYN